MPHYATCVEVDDGTGPYTSLDNCIHSDECKAKSRWRCNSPANGECTEFFSGAGKWSKDDCIADPSCAAPKTTWNCNTLLDGTCVSVNDSTGKYSTKELCLADPSCGKPGLHKKCHWTDTGIPQSCEQNCSNIGAGSCDSDAIRAINFNNKNNYECIEDECKRYYSISDPSAAYNYSIDNQDTCWIYDDSTELTLDVCNFKSNRGRRRLCICSKEP